MLNTSQVEFMICFFKLSNENIKTNNNIEVELNEKLIYNDTGLINHNKQEIKLTPTKLGRNDLCNCNSGKKYKYCHGKN